MAVPTFLHADMVIGTGDLAHYVTSWGDCFRYNGTTKQFVTKHFTASTLKIYSSENPTFQALAARDAALAKKIDDLISSVSTDFIYKNSNNDANITLYRTTQPAALLTQSTHSGAYTGTYGKTEAALNIRVADNTASRRFYRFLGKGDTVTLQLMADDGNSVLLDNLFKVDHVGNALIAGSWSPLTHNSKDLGATAKFWRHLYLGGSFYGNLIPGNTSQTIGSSGSYWGSAYMENLYLSGSVATSLIPGGSPGSLDLGTSAQYWGTIYTGSLVTNAIGFGTISTHLIPVGSGQDIGSASANWRNLFLSGIIRGNLIPDGTFSVGSSGAYWAAGYFADLYATETHTTLKPNVTNSLDLGSTLLKWRHEYLSGNLSLGTGFITNSATVQGNLIPDVGTRSIGASGSASIWQNIYSGALWGFVMAPVGAPYTTDTLALEADYVRSASAGAGSLGKPAWKWGNLYVNSVNPFTGSHFVAIDKTETAELKEGMIVSSTGKVYKESLSDTIPVVKLSRVANCDKVYGILKRKFTEIPSKKSKTKDGKESLRVFNKSILAQAIKENKEVWFVNGVGEGQMRVLCKKGEEPVNGNLLTSSSVPGYAIRQGDSFVRSSTISKVTEDLNWVRIKSSLSYKDMKYKVSLIAVTYHCS